MTVAVEHRVLEERGPAEPEALIREARRHQRRRWLLGACVGLLGAALVSIGVASTWGGGKVPAPSTGNVPPPLALAAQDGVAVGIAVPCASIQYVSTAHLSVYRGTRLVAHKEVTTGTPFRFVLRPGRYVISNDGDPYQPYKPPGDPFFVRAGQRTNVVVMDYCM